MITALDQEKVVALIEADRYDLADEYVRERNAYVYATTQRANDEMCVRIIEASDLRKIIEKCVSLEPNPIDEALLLGTEVLHNRFGLGTLIFNGRNNEGAREIMVQFEKHVQTVSDADPFLVLKPERS